jgi:inner membrane transporter RhtA
MHDGLAANTSGDLTPSGDAPTTKKPRLYARAIEFTPPPGLVLLAIVSVQLGAVLAIKLFPVLGPNGTAFLRRLFSAGLLVIATRPAMASLIRRHFWLLLAYGAILAGMNYFFYEAIARIPLGVAATVEFIGPLTVAALDSRRPADLAWIGLAAAGLLMLTPEIGASLDPLGLLYAGIAGAGWAAFVLLSRRVGTAIPGGGGLAIGMALAAVFLVPFGAVSASAIVFQPTLIVFAVAVAILSTTIPFSLEFEALRRLPPRVYGVLITLEPAVALLIGMLLLGDAVGLEAVGAVACVTTAAIGATLWGRR